MNTYIAYDKDTYRILGFIINNYTTLEETEEVFQSFENYGVGKTNLEIPNNYSNKKVIIENDKIIGFEEIAKVGD